MRLQALFITLVFLAASNIPCFSSGLAVISGGHQDLNHAAGATHQQLGEAEAAGNYHPPIRDMGTLTSGSESSLLGGAAVKAPCACGCDEALPTAAGSWARLGAALVRPEMESLSAEPVVGSQLGVAHALLGVVRSFDHVPISS